MATNIEKAIYSKSLKKSLNKDSSKLFKFKKIEDTLRNRLLFAGGSGATAFGLNKALGSMAPPLKKILLSSLAASALGYLVIPTVNKSVEIARGNDVDKDEKIKKLYDDYSNVISQNIEKKAGFGSLLSLAGKGIRAGAREARKGLFSPAPWKATRTVAGKTTRIPIGDRALSLGVKGAAVYGAAKGAGHFMAVNRKPDYHTVLRNQILAGNVNPREVHSRDMQIVMKRGMK